MIASIHSYGKVHCYLNGVTEPELDGRIFSYNNTQGNGVYKIIHFLQQLLSSVTFKKPFDLIQKSTTRLDIMFPRAGISQGFHP